MTALIIDPGWIHRWISLTMIRHSQDIAGSINHTKSSTSSADLPPRPSHPPPRVVVSSFTPPSTTSLRLRIILAQAENIFFFSSLLLSPSLFYSLLSWRFARIHSSPASEGANGRRQKLLRRKRKEQRIASPGLNQDGVASLQRLRLLRARYARLSINHRRKQRNNVSLSIEKVLIRIDRYFDFHAISKNLLYRDNVIPYRNCERRIFRRFIQNIKIFLRIFVVIFLLSMRYDD